MVYTQQTKRRALPWGADSGPKVTARISAVTCLNL
jgi:hypothetical protein